MANLRGASLHEAALGAALLGGADLSSANLQGANLQYADLLRANLGGANLQGADLHEAGLVEARLSGAHLTGANLRKANLHGAICVRTHLRGADLTECSVYGVSAWGLELDSTTVQANLRVTPYDKPGVTVDDLDVAQVIYLLLHNQNIRRVIDTLTSKVVLILGRFTPECKQVLDALRDELGRRDYLPVIFDFEPSGKRDLTETVSTLAHLAHFVVADLTSAKSIPQELTRIIPILPSVVVQPIIHAEDHEYAMFQDLERYPWVLPTYRYESIEHLLGALQERVIAPAEQKTTELRLR
jgi:hypothetical protein